MGQEMFLTPAQAIAIRKAHGTPTYVYDEARLEGLAGEVLAFPNAFGLTARYAMKALPTAAILRVFARCGLHMDASSGYEAERALHAGIPAAHIQITAQELPDTLKELVTQGCLFNACSLRQLDMYGQLFPGTEVSVRINPGLGSGHSNRTNVGGPSSSFGIWHEHLEEVLGLARAHGLHITAMHTHIGSGADPEAWLHCARLSLDIVRQLPEVTRLSLGGGFKPARLAHETGANLGAIGARLQPVFEQFAKAHGRELHLEIEPGAYLAANAGILLCTVTDIVDTGPEGYTFVKTDTGMTDILRPALYGARHPLTVVHQHIHDKEMVNCLVVGHCCESGDLLTPEPGNPEGLAPCSLSRPEVGDMIVIGGAGAYCAGMATKNYNSFPESPEVLLTRDGEPRLIRRRQTLHQIIQNECDPL